MSASVDLTVTDVVETEDRVAFGGELVATHVRYVLGFNRPASEAEVAVIEESLKDVDVVPSVTADGVEVITADRETPERPVAGIRTQVGRASEEARRRAVEEQERQAVESARSVDLQASLRRELQFEE